MSELYARIAQKCGKPLLDEVAGGRLSDRASKSMIASGSVVSFRA